ncbi:Formin-homology 2 domain-containing protein, partial [Globisporangium splendens]
MGLESRWDPARHAQADSALADKTAWRTLAKPHNNNSNHTSQQTLRRIAHAHETLRVAIEFIGRTATWGNAAVSPIPLNGKDGAANKKPRSPRRQRRASCTLTSISSFSTSREEEESEETQQVNALDDAVHAIATLTLADPFPVTPTSWLTPFDNGEAGALEDASKTLTWNAYFSDKEPPVIIASRRGDFEMVKLLIEIGTSVDVRGEDGETALVAVTRFDRPDMVPLLIDAGGSLGTATTTTASGEPSGKDSAPLLSTTLEKITELCKSTDEFQDKCLNVVDRLKDICAQLCDLNTGNDTSAATIVATAQVEFANVVFHVCKFLLKCEAENQSIISRYIGSCSMATHLRGFHKELDCFLQEYNLNVSNRVHTEWKKSDPEYQLGQARNGAWDNSVMTEDGIDAPAADGPTEAEIAAHRAKYEKYFAMLKVGLPRPVVEHKMRLAGIDPIELDGPRVTIAPAGPTEAEIAAHRAKYEKYFAMLKVGLPRPVVEHKMRLAGIDPIELDGPRVTIAPAGPTEAEIAAHRAKYEKYFAMLKVGLPRPVVEHKMRLAGIDPKELDGPHPVSTNAPTAGSLVNPSAIIKKAKSIRKKLHWEVKRSLSAHIVSPDSLWNFPIVEDTMSEIQISRESREMLEKLFVKTINDAKSKLAGGKNNATNGDDKKKPITALIDMKKSQNIAITLARVKIPFSELKREILAMNSDVLSTAHLKSLMDMWPDHKEQEAINAYDGDTSILGTIGNLLNFGTDADESASAGGFSLSSLMKLSQTKAFVGEITFLHLITKCSKVSLAALLAEKVSLEEGLQSLIHEIQDLVSEAHDDTETDARDAEDFATHATEELASLHDLLQQLNKSKARFLKYFEEEDTTDELDVLLGHISDFTTQFHLEYTNYLETRRQEELLVLKQRAQALRRSMSSPGRHIASPGRHMPSPGRPITSATQRIMRKLCSHNSKGVEVRWSLPLAVRVIAREAARMVLSRQVGSGHESACVETITDEDDVETGAPARTPRRPNANTQSEPSTATHWPVDCAYLTPCLTMRWSSSLCDFSSLRSWCADCAEPQSFTVFFAHRQISFVLTKMATLAEIGAFVNARDTNEKTNVAAYCAPPPIQASRCIVVAGWPPCYCSETTTLLLPAMLAKSDNLRKSTIEVLGMCARLSSCWQETFSVQGCDRCVDGSVQALFFVKITPHLSEQVKQFEIDTLGLDIAPVVPEWFIPEQDIQANALHQSRGLDIVERHGKWLGATAMVSKSQATLADFEKSATRWFQCRHPHVTKLFGACHTSTSRLFVYEHSLNGTLREFLQIGENKKLQWQKVYEAALGLQYLHRRKIVHGDLRSENIVVSNDFRAQIAGLEHRATRLGPECRAYMAPELLHGKGVSLASDIYAFGVCILQLIAESAPEGDRRHKDQNRFESQLLNVEIAHWQLVNKMTKPGPKDRVKIMHVVKKLEQLANEERDEVQARSGFVHCYEEMQIERGVDMSQHVDVRTHMIPQIAKTIPKALQYLHEKCKRWSKMERMTEDVLARLDDLYSQLKKMEHCPRWQADEFGKIVSQFSNCLKPAVSPSSVDKIVRSLKVATLHQTFHNSLDFYLKETNAFTRGPIHKWKHKYRDDLREWSTCATPSTTDSEASTNQSDIVRLVDYRTRPNGFAPSSTAQSSFPTDLSKPLWHLPLSEPRYSADDPIAEGSFGVLFKGDWLSSPIVIKFMGYEGDDGCVSTKLFLHEAQIWWQLNHPHVIELFGACHVQKRYMVCEYAPYGTMGEYLKLEENKHLAWEKLYEVALGLRYLHQCNIVHGDLKCDNILIGADKRAKLADFGLSSIPGAVEVTVSPKHIGAVQWRSPEYLAGARPSFASDIYSLAMCILEVVTNEIPWGSTSLAASVGYRVKRGGRPVRPARMTDEQWHLVEQMTRRDPTQCVQLPYVVQMLFEFAQAASKS